MNHFLLVYDQKQGKLLLPIVKFTDAEGGAAIRRRFELEREYGGQPGIEIVVLSAESEEAIRKTHGRYFKTVRELLADMQATVEGMSAAS